MKIKTLLFVLLLIMAAFGLYILYQSNRISTAPLENQVIELDSIKEIPQGSDYFLAKPVKMLGYKDWIFILDSKFYRVLVYTKNGFSHTIGRPGQGPGEIDQANVFDVFDDRLYLLNQQNRIEVFSISGEYLKSIRFKKPFPYSFPSDLKVCGDYIFIAFDLGETRVIKCDLEGKTISNFINNGMKPNSYKVIISNPVMIYFNSVRSEFALFNLFTGDVELFDPNDGSLIKIVNNPDSKVAQRISLLKSNIKKANMRSMSKEIKSFLMWRAASDIKENRMVIIPSQDTVSDEERRKIVYIFDFNKGMFKQAVFRNKGNDLVIKDCCFIPKNIVFLDYALNLKKGE